jgi:hypothetical protein
LARAYPDLFVDAWMNPQDQWSLACGEGWREILEDLLSDLRIIAREERVPIAIRLVKEKLGVLRVYAEPYNERIEDRIEAATDASAHVCEGCGRPSERRSLAGWITTRCEACLARRAEERR